MKLTLPENAVVKHARTGLNDSVIKIPGMSGWDIVAALAAKNSMPVADICKEADVGVYWDHVILDNSKIN